ncbi:PAS domain S-box protein [Ectothiorhodospiraceae bacterium 2226]|nr:PAS domain S-box protein [Ectothiorhodospiraceae bacterium 2226]
MDKEQTMSDDSLLDPAGAALDPAGAPLDPAGAEALLAAIVDSSTDAIISKDLSGRILTWNRAAERLFGYTAAEAIGQPIFIIIPPERADEPTQILTRIKAGERVAHFDTVRVAKDGTRIDISLTVSPIKDAAGRTIGASKIARDIRERRAAEATLREREARLAARAAELQTLMDEVPAVVFIADDPECHLIRANRAGHELLRVPPGDNTSKTAADPRERPANFRVYRDGAELAPEDLPVQRAARGEYIRNFEEEIRFDDGEVRQMLGNAAPLFDEAGQPRGAVAAFVDVTALKRVEQALRDDHRRKDEFLAVLGHELRNPLAPIANAVELLLVKRGQEPDVRWAADLIQRQLKHIGRLVDDLLDLSRVSRGTLELRRESVDARELASQAAETVTPLLKARGHTLELELPPEPMRVYVDPHRLVQVLLNLLNNAVKYTPEGGRIGLQVAQEDGRLVCRVRDNGIGIAPQDLTRVFELFTRAPGAAAQSPGLGIGLTLVRRVVELHGGRVDVVSEGPGHGSEFTVSLPILQADPLPVVVGGTSAERARVSRRILVVDDNEDGALSLAMLLNGLGHQAEVALTGVEACESARAQQPEVVFLDIDLPDLSGYEVARELRALLGRRVRLIALTGYGGEDAAQRAHDAGFDVYLMKPLLGERLHAIVEGSAPDWAAG